jgi:hypothetical protein
MGVVLSGTAAHAAPGDCLLLGPEGAKQLVCEPHPAPDVPPLDSVCTPLEPAGNLPRKSCQSYFVATGELYGDPQTYTYAPKNNLEAPVIEPYTPRAPYVAPVESYGSSEDDGPLGPYPAPQPVPTRPAPAPVPVVEDTPAPAETPVVDAAPLPAPSGPTAARHETWVDTVDRWVPRVGAFALFVLVMALAWRPRRQ